jgi:hypothetical protein
MSTHEIDIIVQYQHKDNVPCNYTVVMIKRSVSQETFFMSQQQQHYLILTYNVDFAKIIVAYLDKTSKEMKTVFRLALINNSYETLVQAIKDAYEKSATCDNEYFEPSARSLIK